MMRVANSTCHLFTLRLLYCVCLSFLLVLGLDVDLIVSVPEFFYLFSIAICVEIIYMYLL